MATTLRDGTAVEIRPIRADDKARLAAGHARLSPETQRRRYLTAKPRLTAGDLRYLTEVDGHDHVALVAVLPQQPDFIVAVGRFVRLAGDPEAAEFAIVVGDELQGLGLGSQLAELLAQRAAAEGVKRFTATTAGAVWPTAVVPPSPRWTPVSCRTVLPLWVTVCTPV